MTVSLHDSLALSPGVLFRLVDDETVLVNLQSGSYFGLDPVGTRILQLIVERGSLMRVFDAMLAEYTVEPATLEQDLLALAAELRDRGLLDVRDVPPTAPYAP